VKLLGSLTSPYVRKVRILAREKGLDLPFEVTDPHAPDSPVSTHNPLGKVPVLIRPRATALFDSPVITSYLDTLTDPRWYPELWAERFEVLRLEALADGILDATVTRLLETRRPDAQRSDAALGKEEARVALSLQFAEKELEAGLFGHLSSPTMADLALAVSLEYLDFRYPHAWRAAWPKLASWFHRFRERPSFLETLPPGFSRPLPSGSAS
jgi:glutathione S-transferase